MYIDYRGDVYGCGWISEKDTPVANINKNLLLSDIVAQAQNGKFDAMMICPLIGN